MSSELKGIAASVLPQGLPDDAVPFAAVNATVIETTTAQEIAAAVAGKCYYVTEAEAINFTAAEVQLLALQHGTTNVAVISPVDGGDAGGTNRYTFSPPIKIPVGLALNAIGFIANVGDCHVAVRGYLGSDV
jgi:hypothetical protein